MPLIDTSALVEGFYRPPDPLVNPVSGAAEDAVVAWLWRVGFLASPDQETHLRSFKFGLYHGIATPRVDLNSLVLGLKWFCWGSLADDQYDNYQGGDRERRMGRVIADIRAVLAGRPVVAANPVVTGLAEYWPELTANLTAASRRRMSRHFLDYLQAVALQNRYHERNEVPDPATFLILRRNTIAMIFQADVLEVVSGLRVAEPLRRSLEFRELVWCFADITAWHNDVYGLEKDLADRQTCNAVRVVATSEGCNPREAVRRVLDRARTRQRLLLEHERRLPELASTLGLPSSAAEEAARLVADLRAYAYANLVWIHHTARYDLRRPRIEGTFDNLLAQT